MSGVIDSVCDICSVSYNKQAPLEPLSIFSFALLIFGACRWNWIFVSMVMDCRIRNIYFLMFCFQSGMVC